MEIQALMDLFARELGTAPPEPDHGGRFSLFFDETLEVWFVPEGTRALILHGDGGKLPASAPSARDHLKDLLTRHTARFRDHEETLAIDSETGRLTVSQGVDISGITVEGFSRAVEAFVNALEYWTRPAPVSHGGLPPFQVLFS